MTDQQYRDIQGVLMGRPKKEATEEVIDKGIYFSTGHTLLDLVVGGGEKIGCGMGFPSGTIVRDHGDSGSSKSFKLTECIAANYYRFKDRFNWKYCDPENGNTIDSEKLYGFNMFPPAKKEERPVVTAEDWDYDLNKWLDSLHPEDGDVGIYGLDSLDSLSSCDTEERKEKRRTAYDKDKPFEDGTYGTSQAKFLSQEFFRGLTDKLGKKNSLLYIVSQERDALNAGMYAPKYTVGGGRAVTFYETVRLRSKVKQKEEKSGRVTEVVIEVTAEKVRHPRPFRKCFVTVNFTYGIDSLSDEIDFLYNLRSEKTGELLKKANELDWDGTIYTRGDLIKYIETAKLRDELKKRVIDKWEAIEDSIKVERASKYGV